MQCVGTLVTMQRIQQASSEHMPLGTKQHKVATIVAKIVHLAIKYFCINYVFTYVHSVHLLCR